jgi:GNAT superfamily N-acetyltransferase
VREPDRYGASAVFFSAVDGGEVVGAALQTPPWPIQISDATADAARALGRAFAALPDAVIGACGPDDAPRPFAESYAAARGVAFTLGEAMGTFELTEVNAVPVAPGRRIVAGPAHAATLQAWLAGFHAEAVPHEPPVRPDTGQRAVASGRAHLWLDASDAPVAYAFNNRDVEGWASIGPVYTPPEERGRGYATSLVAAVSRLLLDQGRPGCTLYTDLANPTSNAIYERIGYRRVGSAYRYDFR